MTIGYMNPAMAIITDLLFAQKGKVVDAEMILDIQFQMRKTSNLSPEMEKNIDESPVMRFTPEDLERGSHLLLQSGYTKSPAKNVAAKNAATINGKSSKYLLLDCIKALGPVVERRHLVGPMTEIIIKLGLSTKGDAAQKRLTEHLQALTSQGYLIESNSGVLKIYTLTENNINKDHSNE